MEGDAEAGLADHRQVVGTVTDSDGLCKVHLLYLCDELQQFGLSVAVNYFADIAAGQFAVVVNLQLVGIDVVDAVAALQVLAEVGEATAEDGNL